jgi:hypothetical protein
MSANNKCRNRECSPIRSHTRLFILSPLLPVKDADALRLPLFELFGVKEDPGHKSILNTEKYIHWNKQLHHAKDERYYYKAVSTDEETGKRIEEECSMSAQTRQRNVCCSERRNEED